MRARLPVSRNAPLPDAAPPWSGIEPEELEDAARRLCAMRPGSPAAERLMERASYLRTIRTPQSGDCRAVSALFLV